MQSNKRDTDVKNRLLDFVGEGDCLGKDMTEVFWDKENVLYLDRSWGYTGVHLHVSAASLYVHFVPKEKKL